MGCCVSNLERGEAVSRCRARKKYMKRLVEARQAFSASHAMYLRSLRDTGSALLQFSTNESALHHQQQHHVRPQPPAPPSPPPPPRRPPLSPSTDTWSSSMGASPLPPPPPPPPPASSTWDFWDPFVETTARSMTEEEWEEEATTVISEVPVSRSRTESVTAPPSVVSGYSKDTSGTEPFALVKARNSKNIVEIVKEVDDYFLKAANAGAELSVILEVRSPNFSPTQIKGGKVYNYGFSLSPTLWTWGSSPKFDTFGSCLREQVVGNNGGVGHSSTIERLYAWEKKLYEEVKDSEAIKIEHEKKVDQLRKLEVKRAEYLKTEKTKKELEKIESQLMVSSQAIETISAEIIKIRETELYPQLLDLVKGLMCMWRSMYESHQVQTHIVQQFKYLNTIPSIEATSEIHRQSSLQLQLQVQQWHQSFCNLVKAQQEYIQNLTGWLRLSLFQFSKPLLSRNGQESGIYSFCEEWQLAVDRIPDKVASEGIKSFLTVVDAIVVQQTEEHKQKKKSESVFKEFEKKSSELRSLENKHGPFSVPDSSGKDPVAEKRLKVEILRTKAEEEKSKYEKSVNVTRAMTMNNLQMGFPHVFQAMVGFSSVCMQAFASLHNQVQSITQEQLVKRILP
ncbi:protein ALTERED PHOSPHATE STARVATION RESPONSE 1-like [Mangifera indica]|uniref:protein ALTERED PHOSPHATE STARVATION RESPONSE 1-like n=1 Tax=Mangifera indica TaxID=29780 RepID=UPI001CFB0572|nr:protein ALTERED PHOSPHATE STARVATION RESPONSE 1-like [Mangifera indica]